MVSLRRWLCAWLALWIALQGAGSAWAALQGVWHRHRPTVAAAPAAPTAALRWKHGAAAQDVHARWHDEGVAHRHAVSDGSVWSPADDAASDAVGHLACLLAAGTEARWQPAVAARHVRSDARGWSATTRSIRPPLRPPRA
jgi:hypothetical protein